MSHLYAALRPRFQSYHSVRLKASGWRSPLPVLRKRADKSKTSCRRKVASEWAGSLGLGERWPLQGGASVSLDSRRLCGLWGLIRNNASALGGLPDLASRLSERVQLGLREISAEFSSNPSARLSDPCPEGGAAREKTRKTNVCLAVFVQVLEPSLVDFVPYQHGKWTFTLTTSHCLSFLHRDGVKINSRVIDAQREQRACWLSYRGDETGWIWRTGCGWYSVKCKYRGAGGGENRMVSQLRIVTFYVNKNLRGCSVSKEI